MNTGELYLALKERFAPPAWAFLREVGNATGSNCRRHADAVAMSIWPSRGLELHGIEVKASRSDWLKELENPEKAESVCKFCDRWWLVVGDEKIVRQGELPPTWGLLIPGNGKLKVSVEAPKLDPLPVSRGFLASLLRRTAEGSLEEAEKRKVQAESFEAGRKAEEASSKSTAKRYQELLGKVREFEAASGLHIEYGYEGPTKIGQAVRKVLNGDTPTKNLRQVLGWVEGAAEKLRQAAAEMDAAAPEFLEVSK